MTTLRRERIQKFSAIIRTSIYDYFKIYMDETEVKRIAELLADAAESRSEKRADESPAPKPEIDKVAAWLEMSQYPGAKREARISSIQSYLGETLHRNTETKEWLKFAKFIDDKQQNSGEDVKVFVAWLLSQKNYDPQFWPVSKMMEFWPSAFVSVQSPQRPELEKYVPDNQNQFVPRPK